MFRLELDALFTLATLKMKSSSVINVLSLKELALKKVLSLLPEV
jgi:hypothetical protein